MGEIAEMMLDGTLDELTGEYLGEAVGYPRTIYKNKGSGMYAGVKHWLGIRGKTQHKANKIIVRYAKEVLHQSFLFNGDKTTSKYRKEFIKHLRSVSQLIQMDFKSFTDWYNTNYNANGKTA